MLCHFLLVSFWWEVYFFFFFFTVYVTFLFPCFQDFYITFCVEKFDYNNLSVDFFDLVFKIHSDFWICCLPLLWNLRTCQPLFLQYLFCFYHLFFSFLDFVDINVRSFVVVPQFPKALLFLGLFCLYNKDWVIFVVLSLSSLIHLNSSLCF